MTSSESAEAKLFIFRLTVIRPVGPDGARQSNRLHVRRHKDLSIGIAVIGEARPQSLFLR